MTTINGEVLTLKQAIARAEVIESEWRHAHDVMENFDCLPRKDCACVVAAQWRLAAMNVRLLREEAK